MPLHKEGEHLRFLRRGQSSRADTEEQSWLEGVLKKSLQRWQREARGLENRLH